jgi:hypothetical protein
VDRRQSYGRTAGPPVAMRIHTLPSRVLNKHKRHFRNVRDSRHISLDLTPSVLVTFT